MLLVFSKYNRIVDSMVPLQQVEQDSRLSFGEKNLFNHCIFLRVGELEPSTVTLKLPRGERLQRFEGPYRGHLVRLRIREPSWLTRPCPSPGYQAEPRQPPTAFFYTNFLSCLKIKKSLFRQKNALQKKKPKTQSLRTVSKVRWGEIIYGGKGTNDVQLENSV